MTRDGHAHPNRLEVFGSQIAVRCCCLCCHCLGLSCALSSPTKHIATAERQNIPLATLSSAERCATDCLFFGLCRRSDKTFVRCVGRDTLSDALIARSRAKSSANVSPSVKQTFEAFVLRLVSVASESKWSRSLGSDASSFHG